MSGIFLSGFDSNISGVFNCYRREDVW